MRTSTAAPIDHLLLQISAHLEAKMRQAGLKKKELAALAEINQNTVTAILSGGDMKLSTLIRVTRVISDTDWLLSLLSLPQKTPMERLGPSITHLPAHTEKPAARVMGRKKKL